MSLWPAWEVRLCKVTSAGRHVQGVSQSACTLLLYDTAGLIQSLGEDNVCAEFCMANDTVALCRPFKRPRQDSAGLNSNDAGHSRMVRSRLASSTSSDSPMTDAAAASYTPNHNSPTQDNSAAAGLNGTAHNGLAEGDSAATELNGIAHNGLTEGKSATAGLNGITHQQPNGELRPYEELLQSSPPSASNVTTNGINSVASPLHHESKGNGYTVNGDDAHKMGNAAADSGDVEESSKHKGAPSLKRMSWMEPEAASVNGHPDGQTNGQTYGQTNGQTNGQTHGQANGQAGGQANGQTTEVANGQAPADADGTEWEDVPEGRPSSPVMFEMDSEQTDTAHPLLPAGHAGLSASPVVPPAQPFNMFAGQQVSWGPAVIQIYCIVMLFGDFSKLPSVG